MAFYWFLLAAALALVEMFSPVFGFILVAFAALVASAVAFFSPIFLFQLLAFSVALIFSVGLLRPRIIAKIHSENKILSRTEILLGKKGLVVEPIEPLGKAGRVEVLGQDWAAQSGVAIGVNEEIEVIGADGIVLMVKPV